MKIILEKVICHTRILGTKITFLNESLCWNYYLLTKIQLTLW
jgi:hypothetical protein